MPEGYIPRPKKDQPLDSYVSEELSKYGLSFDDVLKNEDMMKELSDDVEFQRLKTEYSAKDAPSDPEPSSGKKEDPTPPPAEEEKKKPELPPAALGVAEPDSAELTAEDIVTEEPMAVASKASKPVDASFNIRPISLQAEIKCTIAYDKLITIDSFGVEDLVQHSPFFAKRMLKARYLRMDDFCSNFITPGVCGPFPEPDEFGYTKMIGFDFDPYPNMIKDLGMRSVESVVIPFARDRFVPNPNPRAPTSFSMIEQKSGIVHEALLPKGRLEFIMKMHRATNSLYVNRGSPKDNLEAYMAMYMRPSFTQNLKIRVPQQNSVQLDKATIYRMQKLSLNNDNDLMVPMIAIANSLEYGQEIRNRSYVAATSVTSVFAPSQRRLEQPMTSTRAPQKVLQLFSDLSSAPGAEFISKLGAFCLGGRGAELVINDRDPVLQSTDSALLPIAAASNLIMLDRFRIEPSMMRTLLHAVLQPFYSTNAEEQVNRIDFQNNPRVVLDDILPRNEYQAIKLDLQNWILRMLRRPGFRRLPDEDSRIWLADARTTPLLPFDQPDEMTPIRLHTGSQRVENLIYRRQANELKELLLEYVSLYDRITNRSKKSSMMLSTFDSVLKNESHYLSTSMAVVMRTIMRGWESLDLLPPLDGGVPDVHSLDFTDTFVLPFTGAVSFICFGIQDDGLAYTPWIQRKEVPVPSTYPMLLDMEVRVANEILYAARQPNPPFTESDITISPDEFLDMAEFIIKKYLNSTDGSTFGTRHRLRWYLVERTVAIHDRKLDTPGIVDLKITDDDLAVVNTFPRHEVDEIYIKLDDRVQVTQLVNADREHSNYEVFWEDPTFIEDEDGDNIINMIDIINPPPDIAAARPVNFAKYLHKGSKMDLETIKVLARGMYPGKSYVRVPVKTTVVPKEITAEVDQIASENFEIDMKFRSGTNVIVFSAPEIPLYYRWDKNPGSQQLTLDIRVFPSRNVLEDIVLDADPRDGYLEGGNWITNLSGTSFLEDRFVCRRKEEILIEGIDLMIEPYGV